jgi:NADH:ubiquinone oxidoreductase subunit F (NADH-binding)
VNVDAVTFDAAPTPARSAAPAAADDYPGLLLHGVRIARSGPADPRAPYSVESLAQLVHGFGLRPLGTPALVAQLERSELTGRGGAHFPASVKWRSVLRGAGPLTVVANGAESEPLSAKDGTLIRQRPHLVLDGLAITAEALGADRAVIWLHGEDAGTRTAVQDALADRRAWGVQGPAIELVMGPPHYLAGESSAIAQALNGGPTLPTFRRRGMSPFGAPRTLVHNVETLARIALLARGIAPAPTVLLTVLTPIDRLVIEVDRRTLVTEVLERTGWLRAGPPQAVLLGGYGGMWVPWRDVVGATFDEDALRAVGLTSGAGVVAPIAAGACGLAETAAIASYLASMSACQCGPCLFGLPALAESMALLAEGKASRRDRALMLSDLHAVEGRGGCHHPDGATRLIASALNAFAHDVGEHSRGRRCAGARQPTIPVPGVTW